MLKIYLLVVKSSHDGATGRLIAPKEGSQGEGGVGEGQGVAEQGDDACV